MLGPWTGFAQCVILRINELRDLGDASRFEFYERLKPYQAAPPDTLQVNRKHLHEYYIFNVCFAISTANNKDGIYLPADDRRNYIAWSDSKKEDFDDEYWNKIWSWYEQGGFRDVAAYLHTRDVSDFDPKKPPPKTPVFWEIVTLNRGREDDEFADTIDALGNPDALTIEMLTDKVSANGARGSFYEYLTDRKNSRTIPHRLEDAGYVSVWNDTRKDGRWRINGQRQTIYAKAELSLRDRFKAVEKLTGRQR
jgi:hypothetical protein